MEPAVRLEGVRRSFRLGQRALPVLEGVDLVVEEGGRLAVEGVSGAGKTSILMVLGLIDVGYEGGYWLWGRPMGGVSARERRELRLRRIGLAFQDLQLVPSLTAAENVALPAMAAGQPEGEAQERALELLGSLGVADRAGHLPSLLSGGERRRVALARSVVNRPRLLLLDEPTAELDEESTRAVLSFLGDQLATDVTVVAVTHDPRLKALCTAHVRLERGRLDEERAEASPGPAPA